MGIKPPKKLPIVWEHKEKIDQDRFHQAVAMMLDETLKRRDQSQPLDEIRESGMLPVQTRKGCEPQPAASTPPRMRTAKN